MFTDLETLLEPLTMRGIEVIKNATAQMSKPNPIERLFIEFASIKVVIEPPKPQAKPITQNVVPKNF